MTGYLNCIGLVMASSKAVSDPRRARKLGRASIGFSVSGVVVSVIAVVISVCFLTTRDDSCEYIFYQGSCYRYKTYVRSSGLCVSGVKTSSGYCYSNYCSNYQYRGSCYKSRKYVENSVSCSSGVMSSSSYCYFSCVHYEYAGSPCLTIGTPLANCWYSLGRPVTIGTVYHSSKTVNTVKRQSKQQKSPLVYQSSHVYTESAEYTKPRKRRYLARPPSHVLGSGHSQSPVGRADYVSTWTSMRLAPVRCRVLLHSLLPTDDACSSSGLSTTVIKFSIFSDRTRKLSAVPPELRRIR